jgi:hypothetical protein
MKKFTKYLVIVLSFLFFSTIVFAASNAASNTPTVPKNAGAKKSVATIAPTATVVVEPTAVPVAPTVAPTVATEETAVSEPVTEIKKGDSVKVSLGGKKKVHWTDSQKKNYSLVNDETGKNEGNVIAKVESSTNASIALDGNVNTDLKGNEEKAKKERDPFDLVGDANNKTRIGVKGQVSVGGKTVNQISSTANGVKISADGDYLSWLLISGQINLSDYVAIEASRMAGRENQKVTIMGMPLEPGISVAKTTVVIKYYPGKAFDVFPYVGAGVRWLHYDGADLMGGQEIDTTLNKVVIGGVIGFEAPITSAWAVGVHIGYFPNKMTVHLQSGDASTEESYEGGFELIRYF